jgi:hypothetical protein
MQRGDCLPLTQDPIYRTKVIVRKPVKDDFKKRVKLVISSIFSVEIILFGSHSGNSFEFNHRLTGFLNYALFCQSFCLRLNLKPVNYLTTRKSSMATRIILFQLKKLPEITNLTRFLKSFWILYIDQIIVYNMFYSKLTFYIIKDRCQMHALEVFRSPVWLLLHKLSSPHYRYIRKMQRGDRLPLTQGTNFKVSTGMS